MSYNEKSDIWSLGCLLYELCALIPPFTATSQTVLAARIREGRFRRIPAHFSDDLNLMIKQMLTVEDDLRPSIDIILHHPKLCSHVESLSQQNSSSNSSGHGTVMNSNRDSQQENDTEDHRKNAILQMEQALEMKDKALEAKEKEIERREKELILKEKVLEERLMRANTILEQCKKVNGHLKDNNPGEMIYVPNYPAMNYKYPNGKENDVATNIQENHRDKNKKDLELK